MFGETEDSSGSLGSTNGISDPSQEENFDLSLKDRIIDCIAKRNDIIIKSQQKNEPDFTYEERKAMTTELLENNPCQFLYRFGKYLKREHLQYFNSFSDNVEMKFYLQDTQKLLNDSTKRLKMRNRRFGALKRMKSSGSSYFSECEMRKRDPLLYDELVDRNLTDEEWTKANPSGPLNNFSDLLFEQIERNIVKEKQKEQKRLEEECLEEYDDDDMDDDMDEEEEEEYDKRHPLDEGEKELMRREFHTSLHSRFVAGKEKEFDYSAIDESEENDLLEWEARDQEERYFDEEDPVTLPEESEHQENLCNGVHELGLKEHLYGQTDQRTQSPQHEFSLLQSGLSVLANPIIKTTS